MWRALWLLLPGLPGERELLGVGGLTPSLQGSHKHQKEGWPRPFPCPVSSVQCPAQVEEGGEGPLGGDPCSPSFLFGGCKDQGDSTGDPDD